METEYVYRKLLSTNKFLNTIISKISLIPRNFIRNFSFYLIEDLFQGKEPKEKKTNDPAFNFYKFFPLYVEKWNSFRDLCNGNEIGLSFILSMLLNAFQEDFFLKFQEAIDKIWNKFIKTSKESYISGLDIKKKEFLAKKIPILPLFFFKFPEITSYDISLDEILEFLPLIFKNHEIILKTIIFFFCRK